MSYTDVANQVLKIVERIDHIIRSQGGTSSHVAAVRIELPARTYDALVAGAAFPLTQPTMSTSKPSVTLLGVTIVRGASDKEVREEALRRTGMPI